MRRPILYLLSAVCLLGAASAPTQKIVMARVFPSGSNQLGLYIADRDGSNERLLLSAPDDAYDGVWSPDGASIVFTSERDGSADLYRVKPDGTGVERLTDSPAYDDQAAFSPDGKQLAFVTTRAGRRANIWILEVQSRRAKALTTGNGGDFRPAWSPDGQWIAFSSDRGNTLPMAHGRWEHLQLADLYIVHPDGSGLKRITEHGNFCGSPKFADAGHVIAYCMPAEQTLETRRPMPVPGNDTTIVSIDLATLAVTELRAGPGVKMSPAPLPGSDVGYVRKDTEGDGKGIYYTSGARGPRGDVRVAAWSPDGRRVVFHRRVVAPAATWTKTFSPNPTYELILTGILPAFDSSGDKFVFTTRPVGGVLGAGVAVAKSGTDKYDVVYQDKARNILAPQWSPRGDRIMFGVGVFNLFFNGFNGRLGDTTDRPEGGAQVAIINADGSGYAEVTTGPSNNGFPSMAPDGDRFVYRTFGTDGGGGLRIMSLKTKAVTTLTTGDDNFPFWSPRGDRIMFARIDKGEYEIYTIKPDGTGLLQVTHAHGNDAHMGWSPDGDHIVFASTRMGFKDEGVYTDAPQPYGEIFVMRADGTGIEQLTDNQWEEGTPAWQPTGK